MYMRIKFNCCYFAHEEENDQAWLNNCIENSFFNKQEYKKEASDRFNFEKKIKPIYGDKNRTKE